MTLEIKNIKTNKEKYIFGEDKEIKISFEISAIDKDYKIKCIYIKYGFQVFKNGEKIMEKLEKIDLSGLTINFGDTRGFSTIIPIKMPNEKIKGEYNINQVELKNFIQIIADTKLNPFDYHKEYFPNIEIMKRNYHNKKIYETYKKKDLTYILLDDGGFGGSKIDYVNKDFYNYLIKNYKLIKFSKFYTGWYPFMIFLGITISFFPLISDSDFLVNIFPLLLFILFIFLIIPFNLKKIILDKIKNDIIKIKFNNSNIIKKNFYEKNLKIEDIFQDLSINYNGIHNINFGVFLICILKVNIEENDGRHSIVNKYKKNIFSLQLGQYIGGEFSLQNIEKFNINQYLNKLFISPGLLIKNSFFSSNKVELTYEILYNFESLDFIDKYGRMDIS